MAHDKVDWKERLRFYGDLIHQIDRMMVEKSDEELQQLKEDCGQVTSTNCWCFTFDAAKIIAPMIDRELTYRHSLTARPEE
jgi:hypothetical protein